MLCLPDDISYEELYNPNGLILQNIAAEGGVHIFYTAEDSVSQGTPICKFSFNKYLDLLGSYELETGVLGSIEPHIGEPLDNRFINFGDGTVLTQQVTEIFPLPIPFVTQQFSSKNTLDDDIFNAHNKLGYIAGGYYFKQVNFPLH